MERDYKPHLKNVLNVTYGKLVIPLEEPAKISPMVLPLGEDNSIVLI